MKLKQIIAAGIALVSTVTLAKTDSTFEGGADIAYNSKGDIVRGEWTSQFDKARKQAEAEGVPLVVFWANSGCHNCEDVEKQMASSGFKSWMKEKKLYMVLTCNGDDGPCGKTDLKDGAAKAKEYAKDPSGAYPYFGVWWNNGGTKLKQRGTFTGKGLSASQIEKAIMNLLKGYKPCVGGYFADKEQGESRYEIEPTTKQVELILTRDSKNKSAGDDEVVLSKIVDGKTSKDKTTYKAKWAKNAKTTSLIVAVPSGLKAGDKLTAVINGESKADYKCTVYCVEAKPNSAGNPAWKDEPFAFGKWTADFATATNRVATFVGGTAKAYTLVSIQGSLWCPDCANTERNFLDLEEAGTNKFCKWAKDNNVALVSMDIPNYSSKDPNGTGSPSLFTRTAAATTLARASEYPQSGAEERLTNAIVRSGLSYMTRKGISSAAAKETAELFKTLAQKNTDEGGFHRPEDSNAYRTGVPIFVLLRKNGTVAARLTRLASVSPMKADQANFDNYIKRFNEMLNIASGVMAVDNSEIGNNYPSADSIPVKLDGTTVSGRLTHADFQDSFRLEGNGAAVITATVRSYAEDARVTAQFMQEQDGTLVNVGEPVSGAIGGGSGKFFELTADFRRTGPCYLLVKGESITNAEFAVDSPNNTYRLFTVAAQATSLNPQQAKSTVPVAAGEEITLNVTSGKVYRIVGAAPEEGYFKDEGRENLFVAQVTGDAKVKAEAKGTLEYQEWVPSEIGFERASESKGESAGTVKVKVLRNGGVSGKVTATVALDVENTTFYYDHDDKTKPRFWINGQTTEPYFESAELVWEDGDGEAKEISIKLEQDAELVKYYGNGQIALTVSDVSGEQGDATTGTADYTLTVKDESKNTKCKISVLKTDPVWDYKAVAYVRKGEGADIELGRSDVGDVLKNYIIVKSSSKKAVVKAGEGNELFKSGNKQYWEANDYTNKLVHVDLKKMTAGSSATITLTEKKDKKKVVSFAADSSSKQVKVYAVADDAPSFVTNKVGQFKYVTYSYVNESVAFDTAYVKSAKKQLSVKLVKGSLPKGVKASVSNGKLYFKGIPTKAGSFTAYYQAQEKRGKKTVKGLVVKASFRIVDPTTVKSTDAYGYLANAAVKSTRSFNTLPVLAMVDGFYRVVGTLNMTIKKTGKISAKFTGREATVSFSATRWAKKNFEDGDGTLSCKMTKSGYTLTIEAHPDSTVVATIGNEAVLEQEAGTITAGKVWSSKATAKAWKGIYNAVLVPGGKKLATGSDEGTITLAGGVTQPTATNENGEAVFAAPAGYGYVNFKMTKTACEAGKMTWAGKLPNGQKISGTAYLTKGNDKVIGRTGYAYLPIFQRLTEKINDKTIGKDIVALVAEIQDNAATEGGLRYVQGSPDLFPADTLFDLDGDAEKDPSSFPLGDWEHTGVSGTGTDYGMDLHLFGSYYDPEKSLQTCCKEQKVPLDPLLQFGAPYWVGSTSKKERCKAAEIAELDHLKVGKNTISIEGPEPNGFTIKLNRDTGVLSGKIRVYTDKEGESRPKLPNGKTYVEATWSGVMTTGWGADCGCIEDDSLTLPFICGALSFTDEISYLNAAGTTKTVKQLSGGAIYSGAKEKEDK